MALEHTFRWKKMETRKILSAERPLVFIKWRRKMDSGCHWYAMYATHKRQTSKAVATRGGGGRTAHLVDPLSVTFTLTHSTLRHRFRLCVRRAIHSVRSYQFNSLHIIIRSHRNSNIQQATIVVTARYLTISNFWSIIWWHFRVLSFTAINRNRNFSTPLADTSKRERQLEEIINEKKTTNTKMQSRSRTHRLPPHFSHTSILLRFRFASFGADIYR